MYLDKIPNSRRKLLNLFFSLQAFIGKIFQLMWKIPHGSVANHPYTLTKDNSAQNSTLTTLQSPKSILDAICCRFLVFPRSFYRNKTGILHSNFVNEIPPELYTKA